MAKERWVPLHVRVRGDEAAADFLTLREQPSKGLRHSFLEVIQCYLGERESEWDPWRPIVHRWAQLERKTQLGLMPITGSASDAERLVSRSGIELMSATEGLFNMEGLHENNQRWSEYLNKAMAEDGFAWSFVRTANGDGYVATRRLSPGLEALIVAAGESKTARGHLAEALRLTAGLTANPAQAVIAIQKAVEAALLEAFGAKSGMSLGMLISEIRVGSKKFTLPRSAKADEPKKPPVVDPIDMVRGIMEAIHFGNPERHAGSKATPLTRDDALSLLGLASLLIDWLERGQIVPTPRT